MARASRWLSAVLALGALACAALGSSVVQLNMQNLEPTLKSAQVWWRSVGERAPSSRAPLQLVFVAFCADWCPFSRRLKPIFEQASEAWHRENPSSSVAWALVDGVEQGDVADKYFGTFCSGSAAVGALACTNGTLLLQ